MYPEEDLGPAEDRMALFLMQYWGGPRTYSDRRGHPRLRMRHSPFRVDRAAHDAWLRHMRAAVDALQLDEDLERPLWAYLTSAAVAMINTGDALG
jgi:hemoglobin